MPPVPPRGILKNAKRPGFAVDYLMQKGWAPHMAQAMVGNLMRESTSNLNPAARGDINKRTGQATAFGIAQWRGNRFTQLKQFAAANGTDWTDFRTQLDFFDHELRTTYKGAGAELSQSTTLPDAMMAMYHYESPKDPASVEVPKRLALARSIGPIDPNYTEPVQTPRLRSVQSADTAKAVPMNMLRLTPQEHYLYQHHLDNLNNSPVIQPSGDVSTLLQAVVPGPGKRYYNIPTVWNGKVYSVEDSARMAASEGWKNWPSYKTPQEADARYQQMHPLIEQDVVNSGLQGRAANPSDVGGMPGQTVVQRAIPEPDMSPHTSRPGDSGMMTPGQALQNTPTPEDPSATSGDMPPEAYPPPPPTPPSDTQADSSTLKKFGELVFPDMAMDLKMPELPPIPDPPPTEQRVDWSNQWRPVQPRFRERFANLFGGGRDSGS